MDVRYWGRVGSMLVTHPRETVARVRQRNELRRFAHQPSVDYGADPDWERELVGRLGTDGASEGWREILAALERELPDFPYGHDADIRLAGSIWRIVCATNAERVVETGVARGVSSRFALEALEANARGHLWSVDLPPVLTGFHSSVGAAVPERLRHRWTYIRGSSHDRLPRLLREVGSVDVFVQDSLGTAPTVLFELSLAWRALRPGGWLVVSGISRGTGLRSFLGRESPSSVIVAESGAKRSYGGGAVLGQFALLEKRGAPAGDASRGDL
jgi:hypothetical protein